MTEFKCIRCNHINTSGLKCEKCGSILLKLIDKHKQTTLNFK